MALATYADLQAAVANWMARTGDSAITDNVADFIALFEADFRGEPGNRFRQMEVRSTATLTAGSRTLALPVAPDAFLEMRLLKLNTDPAVVLEPMAPSLLFEDYGDSSGERPLRYAVVGSEIAFGPIPDSDYTVEMWFYQFDALSDTNTSNWLLSAQPSLYLYGALEQAFLFDRNPDEAAVWKAKKDETLEKLRGADWSARFSGGPLTMRASGVTVV